MRSQAGSVTTCDTVTESLGESETGICHVPIDETTASPTNTQSHSITYLLVSTGHILATYWSTGLYWSHAGLYWSNGLYWFRLVIYWSLLVYWSPTGLYWFLLVTYWFLLVSTVYLLVSTGQLLVSSGFYCLPTGLYWSHTGLLVYTGLYWSPLVI